MKSNQTKFLILNTKNNKIFLFCSFDGISCLSDAQHWFADGTYHVASNHSNIFTGFEALQKEEVAARAKNDESSGEETADRVDSDDDAENKEVNVIPSTSNELVQSL
ncbi:unnamed protein product [Brachionus calyciflorus]|uniref:Uncharacterized protein n=1 Tax=Brachionus calyciflorus TaxID=104777 RepID=A0A813RSC9_9BILA|nr:unnamed protein product [Brachionus calyciflorus]